MRAVQDQIRPWVPGDLTSLGADGFGFSDTRAAARRFFHIDGPSIAVRTLQVLAARGEVARRVGPGGGREVPPARRRTGRRESGNGSGGDASRPTRR
jgi:pyruvate dehydrogenase E1 component